MIHADDLITTGFEQTPDLVAADDSLLADTAGGLSDTAVRFLKRQARKSKFSPFFEVSTYEQIAVDIDLPLDQLQKLDDALDELVRAGYLQATSTRYNLVNIPSAASATFTPSAM